MWRPNFKPFGDKTSASGASTQIKNQHCFTGKPHEEATGLSYFGARWYDPVLGRFTAIDPVDWNEANPIHSFNRYAYANNNPFKFVDPDGRNSEEADLGLGNECSCNLLAKTFSEYVTEVWNGLVLAAQKPAEFGAFLIGKTKNTSASVGMPDPDDKEKGNDKQKKGKPTRTTDQNKQVSEAARDENIKDKRTLERLKRAVEDESRNGGRNLDYHDIRDIAKQIKDGTY